MFIGLAVLASKGYLPGAKRKKKEIQMGRENTAEKTGFE